MKKLLLLLPVVMIAAGCGLKAQTYVMTRERADIAPEGNGGYISGKGQVLEPARKTRKVYVFEVTKALPQSEVKKIEQETITQTTEQVETPAVSETPKATQEMASSRRVVIQPIEDEPVAQENKAEVAQPVAQGPSEDVEYVVQKDDTLQKIAYKFYNSHNKWVKIYQANKERIKNPNVLRPGTKIIIPAVK